MPRIVIAEARLKKGSEEESMRRLRRLFPGLVVQIVSLHDEPAADEISMIAEQTRWALSHGSLLTEKPEFDLLLRLAGTTQISEAISRIGYGEEGRRFLIAFGRQEMMSSLKKILGAGEEFLVIEPEAPGSGDLTAVEAAALLAAKKA